MLTTQDTLSDEAQDADQRHAAISAQLDELMVKHLSLLVQTLERTGISRATAIGAAGAIVCSLVGGRIPPEWGDSVMSTVAASFEAEEQTDGE